MFNIKEVLNYFFFFFFNQLYFVFLDCGDQMLIIKS